MFSRVAPWAEELWTERATDAHQQGGKPQPGPSNKQFFLRIAGLSHSGGTKFSAVKNTLAHDLEVVLPSPSKSILLHTKIRRVSPGKLRVLRGYTMWLPLIRRGCGGWAWDSQSLT